MFNVGDVVEIVSDVNKSYDFTRVGSYGIVLAVTSKHSVRVKFDFINNPSWGGRNFTFSINPADLDFREHGLSLVTRKIRSIYARQHRRTGQSCFL